MIDQLDIVEIALRGASAGTTLLVAGLLLTSGAPRVRRLLGGLFMWGTANYMLISAPDAYDILGPLTASMKIFAIYNGVFFWWFAMSLFDDAFQWTWWKIAPFVLMIVLHPPIAVWAPLGLASAEQIIHGALTVAMMAHAVWIALGERGDDLVGPRRRFRVFFAAGIGAAGIAISVGENIETFFGLPEAATLVHAILLTMLTYVFSAWLLAPNSELLGAARVRVAPAGRIAPLARTPAAASDAAPHGRLTALMEAGVYREEGLSVARLAEKVGVPEHQLRRLINRDLGFRNFSAFLNERRIADACAILSDPNAARKQILQIALELGYGSIAPFNRAFKQATGQTPSEYRKSALNGGAPIARREADQF